MPKVTYNPTTKIWSGQSRDILFNNQPIGNFIWESFTKDPNYVVQINDDSGVVYKRAECHRDAVNVARSLLEAGVKPGDVVVFIFNNHYWSSALLVGCIFAGAPFLPLEMNLEYGALKNLLNKSRPKVVICEKQEHDNVVKASSEIGLDCKIFVDDEQYPDNIQKLMEDRGDIESFKIHQVDDVQKTPVAIVASSATSGPHKLIAISHAQLLQNLPVDVGLIKTICSFSNLNWITGIVLTLMSCVLETTRILTTEPFSPELLFTQIETYKINALLIQPDRLNQCLRCPKIDSVDFSSVFLCAVSGKPLSPYMKERFESYITMGGVVTTYGMTEFAGSVTSSLDASEVLNSCGLLVDGSHAKIVNEAGEQLGVKEVGEILIKPFQPFSGYYNDPQKNKEVNAGDGFIRTGDLGYFDADGELFIVDRKKEIIVMGSAFVYPSQLEHVINQCEDVLDVCVVDIPCSELFFVPVAAVVRAPNSNLTESQIVRFVEERQPSDQTLRGGVVFVDYLPKTSTGKFKRYMVRELVLKEKQSRQQR